MSKKIPLISPDNCLGCGTCIALCPNNFSINDVGKAECINLDSINEEEVQNAIDSCPVVAISWKEEE